MAASWVQSGGVRRGLHAPPCLSTVVLSKDVGTSTRSVGHISAFVRCGFFFLLGFFFISATSVSLAAAEGDGPEADGNIPLSSPGQVLPTEVLDAAFNAVQGFPDTPSQRKTVNLGVKRDELQEALGKELQALKDDDDKQAEKMEELLKEKQKHWKKIIGISSGAAAFGAVSTAVAGYAKSKPGRLQRHQTALSATQFVTAMLVGLGVVTAIKYATDLPLLKEQTPAIVKAFRENLAKDRRGLENALALAKRRQELAKQERAGLLAEDFAVKEAVEKQ